MPPDNSQLLLFDEFELDLRARSLRRAGNLVPLTAKVYDALLLLVSRHGQVVDKDEMLRVLWPDTVVEEGNLHHYISTIRKLLGETADARRFIVTAPGRGYSFVAPVRVRAARAPRLQRLDRVAILGIIAAGLIAVGWWLSRSGAPDRIAQPVPVMAMPGTADGPAFSRDGRHIAFSWRPEGRQHSHISVKSLGGSDAAVQITAGPYSDTAPVWSPDGRELVFLRRADSSDRLLHCLVPSSGGAVRTIHSSSVAVPPGISGILDAWSSDGKELMFAERPRLYVVVLASGAVRPLTHPLAPHVDLSPAVSPDGNRVAFLRMQTRGWEILVMPAAGGEPQTVIGPDGDVDRSSLAWAPDSRHIVYRSTRGELWQTDLSGRNRERTRVGGSSSAFPATSVSGDLAFIDSLRQVALKRIDPPVRGAQGDVQVLFESTRTAYDPQWSPDGKRLAIYSDRSGSMEIWTCDAHGENRRQLTSFGGPFTRNPRWSPDGRSIAFDSALGDHPSIYVIAADGGSARRVTDGSFDDLIPAWSANGQYLYFASRRTGNFEIWKVPAGGGAPRQVTFLGAFFPSVSKDGYVYYVRAVGAKTLLRMPESGGPEEVVIDDALGFQAWWALTQAGIVYIDRQNMLRYFDLSTRSTGAALAVFKPAELSVATTIAASSDGRSVLCPVITRELSDVMLVRRYWCAMDLVAE